MQDSGFDSPTAPVVKYYPEDDSDGSALVALIASAVSGFIVGLFTSWIF